MSTFEGVRLVTGWQRPGANHGCKPVEIVPGLWTAHYHDIDTKEKLFAVVPDKIRLVVNTATCQCEARTGFFGDNVEVLAIDLEDDPDPKKKFDNGQLIASDCTQADVSLKKRFAGDAKKDFGKVIEAIAKTIKEGGIALVHCHASISRSAAFILAYLIQSKGISAIEATKLMKEKWAATWPCDRFVIQLLQFERELKSPKVFPAPRSTFEEVRQVTGWKRPDANHGCKPVEILPGLWTAHYHDIDTKEKLFAVVPDKIRLVVNTATCQCEARTGFFGDNVEVLAIDLEDDPDARKKFDNGQTIASECTKPDLPLEKRFPGDAKKDFGKVNEAISKTIREGGIALVHCHASISRSAAFILAYIIEKEDLSVVEAAKLMRKKWAATWPCDRFVDQLIEWEQEVAASKETPATTCLMC